MRKKLPSELILSFSSSSSTTTTNRLAGLWVSIITITTVVFTSQQAAAAAAGASPLGNNPPHLVSYDAEIGKDDLFRSIVTEEACNKAHVIDPPSSSSSDSEDEVEEMFHEAGIWMPRSKEWIVTSNRLTSAKGEQPYVDVSAIDWKERTVRPLDHLSSSILMGNGGTADGSGGAYICSQGLGRIGGGIYHTHCCNTQEKATLIVGGDAGGCAQQQELLLNSPNDICLYQNKWLLFTDPTYGFEQGFRSGKPNSYYKNCVWCASATNGSILFPLIKTQLGKPNGICLSPNQQILYVTDTAYATGREGEEEIDPTQPRHVLAYDISMGNVRDKENQDMDNDSMLPKVSNRRILFDFCCNHGVPDGIKVDVDGNIYVGAGDGLRIYSPAGERLGRLLVEGGVANLCFGGDDLRDLLLLNEKRAIVIRMERPGVNLQPNYCG